VELQEPALRLMTWVEANPTALCPSGSSADVIAKTTG